MKKIKYELQNIIIGNGQDGSTSKLEKVHSFLRANAQTGTKSEKKEYLKSEEESLLVDFALREDLIYSASIPADAFISEGAEQKVYRFDSHSVIKLNGSVFMNIGLIISIAYLSIIIFLIQHLTVFLALKS